MAAQDEIRSLLENVLEQFDPTIDLSAGSPAQVKVITPVIDRLGDDPFTTDIPSFLRDRIVQEFPQLAADNAGMLEDLVTKPLQVILEPFKRAVTDVKLNQSVRNAALMSDDEADALAANFFEERTEGNAASGPVRLFFSAPTTVRVTTDRRLSTSGGLNFFPVENFNISSAQMLFNRQGSFYYMDIVVRAESAGEDFNVEKDAINFIDSVPGVVKVANLTDISNGSPREDNETFLGRMEQTLTERSIVTLRGVSTRVPKTFSGVRALSVVGAGETGMDRDILEGTGEGFLTSAGKGTLYGDWLFFSNVLYFDNGPSNDIDIAAGDTVRLYLENTGVDPAHVIKEAKVLTVYKTALVPGSFTSEVQYFLVLDQSIELAAPSPAAVRIAVFKPGFITISKVPGGQLQTTVPDGIIHIGGHTDIFVRPQADEQNSLTLTNVTDSRTKLARIDFSVTLNSNLVTIAGADISSLKSLGIKAGMTFVAETGENVTGSYKILVVEASGDATKTFRVDQLFEATRTGVRGRIVDSITIDLVEPKIPKLPFNTGSVSDLRTTVGLNLFSFDLLDVKDFGTQVGDTVRILSGPDAGDFTIVAFDTDGLLMDRAASASGVNLGYQIFTKADGVSLPLVRVKSLEVLDSTGQGTGITIPYGDAVDVRPECDYDTAGKEANVFSKSLIAFPDAVSLWYSSTGAKLLPDDVAVSGDPGAVDARFTSALGGPPYRGIEPADGIIRKIPSHSSNPIQTTEVNLPPFMGNGKRDKVLILTNQEDVEFTTDVSGASHRTSPAAKTKVGDALFIAEGPNQGKYIIRDVRKMGLWSRTGHGHHNVVLAQIDPPLKVDPVRTAINLINAVNPGGSQISATDLFNILGWATDFDSASSTWNTVFIPRLRTALSSASIGLGSFFPTDASVKAFIEPLARTSYAIGPSARGSMRLYFQEPTSCEFFSGDEPTTFTSALDETKVFRLDPAISPAQILPESETDDLPTSWSRDSYMLTTASNLALTLIGGSFVEKGVQIGDILEFCPAFNDMLSRKNMSSSLLLVTHEGSTRVEVLINPAVMNQLAFEPGQLLFIDSGPDIGAYTIIKVIQNVTPPFSGTPVAHLQLDRPLTHSTLPIPASISYTGAAADSGKKKIYRPTSDTVFAAVNIGDWVTLSGIRSIAQLVAGEDAAFLGTFKVTDKNLEASGPFAGQNFLELDRSENFPSVVSGADGIYWVKLSEAPETTPANTTGGGRNISDQYVRVRLYTPIRHRRSINIFWNSTPSPILEDTEQIRLLNPITLTNESVPGNWNHKMPYRITRPGVRRISSTSMADQREGALYFTELPVVGYGPGAEMNVTPDEGFFLSGKRNIQGYTMEVENEILTYSLQEKVKVILPNAVLPVGSSPGLDNEIALAGQSVQVIYNSASLVEDLQRFVNSPLDRVTVANLLVRHYLPSYVFLDVTYTGGSDVDVVAKDIVAYINSIDPVSTRIRMDQIVDLIKRRSASSVILPITVIALTHGTDRRIRGMRSKDGIGLTDQPTFKGTFSQTFFIPGPDTSEQEVRPTGEQIFLKRL